MNGEITVTDGPYTETKEVLGGFFIVSADSYEEAIEITGTCPHMKYGVRAIVRQVEEMMAPA